MTALPPAVKPRDSIFQMLSHVFAQNKNTRAELIYPQRKLHVRLNPLCNVRVFGFKDFRLKKGLIDVKLYMAHTTTQLISNSGCEGGFSALVLLRVY